MSNLVSAEQVEIKKISLTSERFLEGRELLLAGTENSAPSVLALEIYENIYYPYLTGNLYFIDDNDIARTIRLNGTERIIIQFKSPETISFIEKTFIISGVTRNTKISDSISHLTFELTEDHGYFNELEMINKSYTGTGASIIKKLLEDNTTKKLVAEAEEIDQPPFRYIVPNLSCYEAINTVIKHISTSEGLPYFFFSSLVTDDLVLTDLGTIMRKEPFNKNLKPFTYSRAIQSSNSDLVSQAFEIMSMSSDYTYDTLSMAKRGALGSTANLTNSNTGKLIPFSVDMASQFSKIIDENKDIFQGITLPIDTFFRIDGRLSEGFGDFNSKVYSTLAANSFKDTNSLVSDNNTMVKLIIKNNFVKHLGNNSFIIKVPGVTFGIKNRDRAVGSQIKIKILRDGDPESSNFLEDEKRSGDYIIMSKKHSFDVKANSHNITMRVGRLGIPKDVAS